jgi:hypothetical protein
MKRFITIGTIALLVVFTMSTQAGKVNPLVSASLTPFQLDRNVEEYGFPVWNPTNCTWDPDDHYEFIKQGYLDSGASAVFSGCLIAQPDPVGGFHWALHPRLRLSVVSDEPVTSTICYQPQEWCLSVGALACPSGPYYDPASPAIVVIPDSLGGYGVPTTWALTITNFGSRRASPIGVSVLGGNDQDQCPGQVEVPVVSSDHTFWYQ